MSQHKSFCDYWLSVNQLTDKMRYEEDEYFNMAVKVRSWVDLSSKGKPKPVNVLSDNLQYDEEF